MVTDIFFDLDRTLWDFDTNSDTALRVVFEELGLDTAIESRDNFVKDYIRINEEMWDLYRQGKISKESLRVKRFDDALKLHGVDNQKLATEYCDRYIDFCPELTATFPGTHDMLEELKELGKKLHIITNGFSEVQYRKLSNCGLENFFDVIICSDQIGVNKPDPEIFRVAMKKSGAAAAASMMIGDHPEIDVLGANQVGIRGVLFDPNEHYQPHPSMERIKHLGELPSLVLGVAL